MFIPIESVNLFIYLAYKQLIIPSKYRPNSNPTIQDTFPNQVLLSKNKWINDCDVSLEVDIAEYYLTPLDNEFYLLNGVIPISRIKKIWFKDEEQMKVTIGNIRISSAFIPKELIAIDNTHRVKEVDINEFKFKDTLPSIDFSKEIKLFDKYMGGLIVLKNFFYHEYEFLRKNLNRKRKNSLLKLLNGNSNLIKIILDRQISIEDVENSAKKYGQTFKKFAGMVEVDTIDRNTPTYIFAILNRYRKLLSDNLTGLLNKLEDLKSINIEKYRGILFSYGLMVGYSGLSFKFYFENKKFFNRLKFDNRDDFKTLEYVYQATFIKDKYIPVKTPKKERIKFIKQNIEKINIKDLIKKFNIGKRTIKEDIKNTILKSNKSFIEKFALFKKFRIRFDKGFEKEQLEIVIKETNLSIKELSNRIGIKEKTLKYEIKEIIFNSNYSFSYKTKLLKKFNIKVPKKLRILELKRLLKNSNLTARKLSKKLGVKVETIRRYLKEIGALKNIDGKRIKYSMKK